MVDVAALLKAASYGALTLFYLSLADEYEREGRVRRSWLYRGVAMSVLTIATVTAYVYLL